MKNHQKTLCARDNSRFRFVSAPIQLTLRAHRLALPAFFVGCLHILLPIAESAADMVVVANPKSGIDKLSRDEVVNIFLGRFRQLPSGLSAQPVDLPATQPEKATFYHLLVNKDLAEINAYWSRLVFSGRTSPPVQARNTEDVIEFIAKTPGAVGYIDRAKVDARVKLVLELGP